MATHLAHFADHDARRGRAPPTGRPMTSSEWPSSSGRSDRMDPNAQKLFDAIIAIANLFMGLAGAVAVLFVVKGGYAWSTAGENSRSVEGAQRTIANALIGMLIVFFAIVIVNWFGSKIADGFQTITVR